MGLCGALGLLCLLYYLAIGLYAGFSASFSWFWLILGLLFAVSAFAIGYGKRHPGFFPGWFRAAVLSVICVGTVVFGLLVLCVISGMRKQGSKDLTYLVVLGAQVQGETPSRSLQMRLDRALAYARENEDTVLVLSGGQGGGEDISEAECMRRYLLEAGISPDRLVVEDQSTSTLENLRFSDELTGCASERTGIVTNDFHVYRALRLAKKLGYQKAEGIAAASDPLLEVHMVVREVFALVKEKISGNI